MKFSTEFGYFIKMLREYPFTEQIERRCNALKYSMTPDDINSGIKAQNKPQDPKVLIDMIRMETDPVLLKYETQRQAIEQAKAKLLLNEWNVIRDVYILNTMNVDGAMMKYLNASKSYGYDNVIKPFFKDIEQNIYEISLKRKLSIQISEN